MTQKKRQSLTAAIAQSLVYERGAGRTALARACGLAGRSAGSWGETTEALAQLAAALPHRDHRTYTVAEFVEARYCLDQAGRYHERAYAEAMAHAQRIDAAHAAAERRREAVAYIVACGEQDGPETYHDAAEIFRAIFGRDPTCADGLAPDLFSHCCAAVAAEQDDQ